MNAMTIFWPVLAQVFLTLALFIVLGVRKIKAVKAGEVNRQQAALNNQVWPENVVKVSNNIANQFETPVLFFVLCGVIYSLNAVGVATLLLAWVFVISRYAHAYVHIGSNYVPMRFRLFMMGCLVLIAMLILVASEMVTGVIAV